MKRGGVGWTYGLTLLACCGDGASRRNFLAQKIGKILCQDYFSATRFRPGLGQRRRQFVVQRPALWQIARGVGGVQIAPALERAARGSFGADHLGVQHQCAARNAIGPAAFFQPQDALAGQNLPLDDPVQRPGPGNLVGAFGPHAGDVFRRAGGPAGGVLALPIDQVFDRLCPHTQFDDVQMIHDSLMRLTIGSMCG